MKKAIAIIGAILLFLCALGFTLYPIISNMYNEQHQSVIQTHYEEVIQQADTSEIDHAKLAAQEYNQTLQPVGQQTDAFSQSALKNASEEYYKLLNITGTGIMGYVDIPSIYVYLPIYHGTGADSLERGIGHLVGSSLPVGGTGTHAVLTGHSGMANQKMFTDVTTMKVGEVFYLHVLGETLAYQVDQINTVLPHDTTHLGITSNEDLCTLVTCTPVGINTHRLLVRGHRIPYEEAQVIEEEIIEEDEQTTQSTWEQQYMDGLIMGFAILLVVIVLLLIVSAVRDYYE